MNKNFKTDRYHKLLIWNAGLSILLATQNALSMMSFGTLENIFRIGIPVCSLTLFTGLITVHKNKDESKNEDSKFYPFCKEFELTVREQHILSLMLEDKTNQDISDELVISLGTVKTHSHNIFKKLGVNKRCELQEFYKNYEN